MEADYINYGYNILMYVILGLGGIALLYGVYYGSTLYFKWQKYKKYTVLIFKRKKDKDGREIPIFVGSDNGAIFKDKKLKKWAFHLKKANIDLGEEEGSFVNDENRELDIPSIPAEFGGEVVFVEKLGPRKYAVGEPFLINGTVEVKVSEADIAEAMRSYDINARYFGKDNSAIWSFVIYITFAVLVLILVIYTLNQFSVLSEVADKLVATANILADKGSAVPSEVLG